MCGDRRPLQMLVLEAALEQEQAMHSVTKTQLASLREDNQRLRQQLHAIRRHTVVSSEPATYVSLARRFIVFVCSDSAGSPSVRPYTGLFQTQFSVTIKKRRNKTQKKRILNEN